MIRRLHELYVRFWLFVFAAVMPSVHERPEPRAVLVDDAWMLEHERDARFVRLLRHAVVCESCFPELETIPASWDLCARGSAHRAVLVVAERSSSIRELEDLDRAVAT